MTAAFHLNNREANRELKVYNNGRLLPICPIPTCLGVKLDSSAHTRLIDSVLNDALRIVTGCLRPTPTDHLPVLSGIQPAELRRIGTTLSLAYRGSLDPDHILYGLLSGPSDTRQARLRSRRPFVAATRNLFGQPCQTWHPRFWMDKSQMENGVLWKCFQAPCFCARDRCQGCWDGLTPSSLG